MWPESVRESPTERPESVRLSVTLPGEEDGLEGHMGV